MAQSEAIEPRWLSRRLILVVCGVIVAVATVFGILNVALGDSPLTVIGNPVLPDYLADWAGGRFLVEGGADPGQRNEDVEPADGRRINAGTGEQGVAVPAELGKQLRKVRQGRPADDGHVPKGEAFVPKCQLCGPYCGRRAHRFRATEIKGDWRDRCR